MEMMEVVVVMTAEQERAREEASRADLTSWFYE
jgi:hypothetical protein